MGSKLKLSLKKAKVQVRKDLFGANENRESPNPNESALSTIWGESESCAFTQPSTNSVLLSPALKRSPNRFSLTPSPKRKKPSPRTPTPKKKVHNPDPKNSIKNFFPVKERNVIEDGVKHLSQVSSNSCASQPSTSYGSTSLPFHNQPSTSSDIASLHHSQLPKTSTDHSSPPNSVGNNIVLSNNIPSPNPESTTIIMSASVVTPQKNKNTPAKSNTSTPQSAKKTPNSKRKDFYNAFILQVLIEAVMHDSVSEEEEKLLSEADYDIINKFQSLDQPSQRIYARLLNRKIEWIKTSSIGSKYGEFADVQLALVLLEQKGFITSDYSNESIEYLLNLLQIPDLKALCKEYKLPQGGVKEDLISRLLVITTQKGSIKSFFKPIQASNDTSVGDNFRNRLYGRLGSLIKVASGPLETISRCLLLFSYPHYHGAEKDRFSDQLRLVGQLKGLKFPEYEVDRTRIFHSRADFQMYSDAIKMSSEVEEAKEVKDYDTVVKKCGEICKMLESYLCDEQIRFQVEVTPDWLRRFTAGACWVRGLSSGVEVLRKSPETHQQAEQSLELLLNQRLFARHKRGQWYEQLALLYQHNLKDNIKASHTVLRGLRDEYIDEVARRVLCARASMLERRKTNGIVDQLKDALASLRTQVETIDDPPTVTISEQALNGNRTGRKLVYVRDVAEGTMLSSVEEVAIEHFKQQGYIHGIHDEGSIIKSLVFACFWDEIYGEPWVDGHGVFHSGYQTAPLDWNSESFYERRKELFKSKLQDLAEGDMQAVLATFLECHEKNKGLESVVNWKYLERIDYIESFINSLHIDLFLNLCRLLLRHHKTYKAGFPDLTMWNPQEKKCMFVEVKSPNDQLSMKQRVWLNMLNKMGATAILCNVQSVGCRNLKRNTTSADADQD
ncbi:fanconi-associated nuclease 1-like [Macrosteles quadrilineatus]|uniref:fanconi-associated nuclease 1-like n=1 Tax=Macrosteles quadrilineatus TaxID=74068 RepID=UPI0023E15EF7|nr:fanconi-associated nuclease 1-like [Macrosteles quadrilineatus]XP_054278942.1 fanconi-associated nuclease 1-like [Macrosteles quadrilineatus]